MNAQKLTKEMRALLDSARKAQLKEAANWIEEKFFGTEPPLDSGVAWCIWYSRNFNVSSNNAFKEWKRRQEAALVAPNNEIRRPDGGG